MLLRRLAITGTVTTLLASSAMAQSYQPEVGSGNLVPGNRQPRGIVSQQYYYRGASAFAYEPRQNMYGYGNTSAPGASVDKDDMR
jgi:hypothetical protein